jgi:hypothetical protein
MNSDRLNHQRGSDDAGGPVGIGLLVLLILIVLFVSTSSSTISASTRYEYQRCMAAAQTPTDQKLRDPTQPTPGAKP